MWRSMIKVAAATAAFGLVHSALASRRAKRAAAQAFGERDRNGLYRVFYLAQSAVTFAMLAAYVRKQPSREVYRVHGPLALLMHAGQMLALLHATAAARQVGFTRILGLESLRCWLGDGPVPPEPEAQGPALDLEGLTHDAGPFAWSRHPLNFAPLPALWLHPRMTTSLLAFNIAATVYLVVGSVHEEARLRETYGEAYSAYRRSGVPFYLPSPDQSAFVPIGAVAHLAAQHDNLEGSRPATQIHPARRTTRRSTSRQGNALWGGWVTLEGGLDRIVEAAQQIFRILTVPGSDLVIAPQHTLVRPNQEQGGTHLITRIVRGRHPRWAVCTPPGDFFKRNAIAAWPGD